MNIKGYIRLKVDQATDLTDKKSDSIRTVGNRKAIQILNTEILPKSQTFDKKQKHVARTSILYHIYFASKLYLFLVYAFEAIPKKTDGNKTVDF